MTATGLPRHEGRIWSRKGTYASLWPPRLTCGDYLNMIAKVDVSDIRCRCICRIIVRDIRFVASRVYTMAVTWPRVMCHRYLIPLFWRRPPGLHKPQNREGKEWKDNIKQSCRVRTRTDSKVPLPIGTAHGDLSADPAHGETPSPLCQRHLYWAEIQSKEVWRREEKRRNKERNARLITFLWSRVPKL